MIDASKPPPPLPPSYFAPKPPIDIHVDFYPGDPGYIPPHADPEHPLNVQMQMPMPGQFLPPMPYVPHPI